jgi:hypothetical protein
VSGNSILPKNYDSWSFFKQFDKFFTGTNHQKNIFDDLTFRYYDSDETSDISHLDSDDGKFFCSDYSFLQSPSYSFDTTSWVSGLPSPALSDFSQLQIIQKKTKLLQKKSKKFSNVNKFFHT